VSASGDRATIGTHLARVARGSHLLVLVLALGGGCAAAAEATPQASITPDARVQAALERVAQGATSKSSPRRPAT
jgi:hypothetical protein